MTDDDYAAFINQIGRPGVRKAQKYLSDKQIERRDRVLELRKLGLSYNLIAQQMGTTRSAIAGLAMRLGLKGSSSIKKHNRHKTKARPPKQPIKLPVFTLPPEPPKQANWIGISFNELTERTCRFPAGDEAPFTYCGDPTADIYAKRPYCRFHMGLTRYVLHHYRTAKTNKHQQDTANRLEGQESTGYVDKPSERDAAGAMALDQEQPDNGAIRGANYPSDKLSWGFGQQPQEPLGFSG